MESKLLLKGIRYLNPNTMRLETGDIRIKNDRIIEIGYNLSLKYQEELLNHSNNIILPGLTNAHLHPSKEIYGSLLDSSPIDTILDTVHKNNELEGSANQYVSSLKSISNALIKGVTSFGIFTSRIESDYQAVEASQVRCVINFCQSNHWSGSGKGPQSKSVDRILTEYRAAEKFYQNDLIKLMPATASELSADDELLIELHKIAVKNKKTFTLHVHEGSHQVNSHVTVHSNSGIKRLYSLGVLDEHTTLIHASYLNQHDCDIIIKSRCNLVHCPVSNSFVGAGTMPLKEFLMTNIVGIGTDAAMVNPVNDLTFDALFALYHHGDGDFSKKISAKEILYMLTIGGAKALGLSEIGQIKSGYKADLVIYHGDEIDNDYINTPVSVLKMINKEKPSDVLIDGKFIVRDHHFNNNEIKHNVDRYYSLMRKVEL